MGTALQEVRLGAIRRLTQGHLSARLVESGAGPVCYALGWLPGDLIGYHCRTQPHAETE